MEDTLLAILPVGAGPVITGVVEAAKKAGLPARFGAVTAVALGLAVGAAAVLEGTVGSPLLGLLAGGGVGLSAVGAYEGGRHVKRELTG